MKSHVSIKIFLEDNELINHDAWCRFVIIVLGRILNNDVREMKVCMACCVIREEMIMELESTFL